MAQVAWHVRNMIELSKQSQQNIVADLMGHPVICHHSLVPVLNVCPFLSQIVFVYEAK